MPFLREREAEGGFAMYLAKQEGRETLGTFLKVRHENVRKATPYAPTYRKREKVTRKVTCSLPIKAKHTKATVLAPLLPILSHLLQQPKVDGLGPRHFLPSWFLRLVILLRV